MCHVSFSFTLPHSWAFPRRRWYSEWSYPLKIEPRENMETLQRLTTYLSFYKKHVFIELSSFKKEKVRPYLCNNHRCHSCPWEWSKASSPPRSSDPKRRDNKEVRLVHKQPIQEQHLAAGYMRFWLLSFNNQLYQLYHPSVVTFLRKQGTTVPHNLSVYQSNVSSGRGDC